MGKYDDITSQPLPDFTGFTKIEGLPTVDRRYLDRAERPVETINLLKEFLKILTYKKGWSFDIAPFGYGVALRITVQTIDSTGVYASEVQLCRRCLEDLEAQERDNDYAFITNEYVARFKTPIYRGPFWVSHMFTIPPYPMNDLEIEDWVLRQIINVETHEACEFFKVDGRATYFPHKPHHGPYTVERVDQVGWKEAQDKKAEMETRAGNLTVKVPMKFVKQDVGKDMDDDIDIIKAMNAWRKG